MGGTQRLPRAVRVEAVSDVLTLLVFDATHDEAVGSRVVLVVGVAGGVGDVLPQTLLLERGLHTGLPLAEVVIVEQLHRNGGAGGVVRHGEARREKGKRERTDTNVPRRSTAR